MKIDIWSDVVCPWCWIGKQRFEQGLALLGDEAPPVEITWHPFLLDPDAGTTPVPLREAYQAKFGSAERTAQILSQTQATARGEGLPMDFDQGQVRVTTLPAHRLLWLAGRENVQPAVAEALFRAHFVHGRNLAEPQTLIEAAAAGGIDAAQVTALLAGDEGLEEIQAQLAHAQAMGIQSVPTFVINDQYAIQGAQAPDAFAQALAQIAAEQAGQASPGPAGDACDADGCTPRG